MNQLKVVVVRDRCMGIAMCLELAPRAFELDDQGIAVLREGSDVSETELVDAAHGCPTSAIEIFRGEEKIA